MGAKHGGRLAIDIHLEKGQERVKISCKCPDIAFVSNSTRKHRQGLGNETVPWNVACIQITSQYLSRLLPPSHSLESSSSKVICAGPGWQISARRAVKFFNLDCPSVFQNSYQLQILFAGNNSSSCMEIFHLTLGTHTLPFSALHTDR